MAYVDGFVLPVQKKGIKQYTKLAKHASKIWIEHGALAYYEALADDMNAKGMVPFPKIAGAKKNETVIFAWVIYKSRAHRNSVNAKIMKDKRMACMDVKDMPFDCKRMAYGGFKIIVDA